MFSKRILFLFLTLTNLLQAKPVVDFRDSNIHNFYKKPSYERPDYVLMNKGKNSHVIILSDWKLREVDEYRKQGYKKIVAFLMEPRVVYDWTYDYIIKNAHKFDLILTFDHYLLKKYPEKCKYIHAVVPCFIQHSGVHPKSQLCSMIVGRTDETKGRKLRGAVIEKYKNFFDAYKTNETPPAPWKDPWLNDFCFSVVIENSQETYYFTEKILDCFITGTIPIYWGTPKIGEFFDKEGMITFNSLRELEEVLSKLSFEEYQRRLPAVLNNFKLAAKYPHMNFRDVPERPCIMDCIWPYLEPFFRE